MRPIHPLNLMWARACEMLERADRRLASGTSRTALAWEPAVDVFVGDTDVLVRFAVPDVERDDIDVGIEIGVLRLSGMRRAAAFPPGRQVRRLEIPYGRIERRVTLPPGRYRLAAEQYRNGCLEIRLERTSDHD